MPATAKWTTNKIGLTGCTAGPARLVTPQESAVRLNYALLIKELAPQYLIGLVADLVLKKG